MGHSAFHELRWSLEHGETKAAGAHKMQSTGEEKASQRQSLETGKSPINIQQRLAHLCEESVQGPGI